MGRVINPETAGKERNLLIRGVVVAMRELMKQASQDELSRDLAAFIGLSLLEIFETINVSVAAWERRNYWVKADRYRMEWQWSQVLGQRLCRAVLEEEWLTIATLMAEIAQKVMHVDVPKRHGVGEAWVGAWEQLQDRDQAGDLVVVA